MRSVFEVKRRSVVNLWTACGYPAVQSQFSTAQRPKSNSLMVAKGSLGPHMCTVCIQPYHSIVRFRKLKHLFKVMVGSSLIIRLSYLFVSNSEFRFRFLFWNVACFVLLYPISDKLCLGPADSQHRSCGSCCREKNFFYNENNKAYC